MHPEAESTDPEIFAERQYLERCYAALRRMRDDLHTRLSTGTGEGEEVMDKYYNHTVRQLRTRQSEDMAADLEGAPLFFGRLSYPLGEVYADPSEAPDVERTDADHVYVGRRGVLDDDHARMVIDWRTPIASAFYEANPADPMGVAVRRRYGFDQEGTLSAFEDEPIDHRTESENDTGLLAAEIERPRKGPMRDIVSTIQPEQFSLVRAPIERTLCIQGAPGTGKTAVGLHRLAYLLYTKRDQLRRNGGVAVIGPNRSFLSYIRNVLPALGEIEVIQTTIDELLGSGIDHDDRLSLGVDAPATAQVKGDARMAKVIHRHVWAHLRLSPEPIEIRYRHRTWHISAEELQGEVRALRARGTSYGVGADLLAQRLARLVLRQIEETGSSATSTALRDLQRSKAITRAARQMWPKIEPIRAIFTLLTKPAELSQAADGILSPDEQRAILLQPQPRSPRTMAWTSLDLALIDEAAALLKRPDRIGHFMLDEAQDLSPMQLRSIARRMAAECTVLGDLAQATNPAAASDWKAVLQHLDRPEAQIAELTRGYRVPAQVIDYAARLLPIVAPELGSPASFRHPLDALTVRSVAPEEFKAAVVTACIAALEREGSAGLIAADNDIEALSSVVRAAGIPHTVLSDDERPLDVERLTIVPARLSSGMEYDTAIVIEPAHICQAEQRGLQRLYVALTRAVTSLTVLHRDPLPHPLQNNNLIAAT